MAPDLYYRTLDKIFEEMKRYAEEAQNWGAGVTGRGAERLGRVAGLGTAMCEVISGSGELGLETTIYRFDALSQQYPCTKAVMDELMKRLEAPAQITA